MNDKSINLVNLTPHTINIIGIGEVESNGFVRCSTTKEKVGELHVNGKMINVFRTIYGEVEGLPPEQTGTFYVVSAIVANAIKNNTGRKDILIADKVIRDADGNVLGCKALGIV